MKERGWLNLSSFLAVQLWISQEGQDLPLVASKISDWSFGSHQNVSKSTGSSGDEGEVIWASFPLFLNSSDFFFKRPQESIWPLLSPPQRPSMVPLTLDWLTTRKAFLQFSSWGYLPSLLAGLRELGSQCSWIDHAEWKSSKTEKHRPLSFSALLRGSWTTSFVLAKARWIGSFPRL